MSRTSRSQRQQVEDHGGAATPAAHVVFGCILALVQFSAVWSLDPRSFRNTGTERVCISPPWLFWVTPPSLLDGVELRLAG